MFNLTGLKNTNHKITPEMSKYLKEYTNKWLLNLKESYSNKSLLEINNNGIRVSDLVKSKYEDTNFPKCYFILPFVSLFSFLAGYNFYNIIHKD